ncbi:sortase [Nocardioides sp. cx-169]|uniref:sortase domain-containing protein n=1 Tax=Nocardioides sp. cx-169 TaxID=2899080 RepID=UPI001E360984|nr:sortase [Nocardioides sp. cx-169]MCD4535367.1 sortase [Nocardioides sp. cx-169]
MPSHRLSLGGALLLAALVVSGCDGSRGAEGSQPRRTSSPGGSPAPPTSSATPTPTTSADEPEPPYQVSDGRPRRATMTIPALGLRQLRVVPYRGATDDAPGTEIQNRGHAASPFGPRGGVGPGGVGNYQVTAHRTSSTRAFERLPEVRRGDRVVVRAGGVDYVYRITGTRETSFRSPRSLREQRAAVPGRPGLTATRAMITLSTCATQEDHAVGNYWADEFDNPEHRIDKIGVLVQSRRPG